MTNGLTVNYTYDARNRLTSETNGAGETIKYAYDKLGNRISMTDPRGSAAADGTFTTWYVYDVLNRHIRTVMPDTSVPADPYGNPALFDNPYIEYTYYPNGLKAAGNIRQVTDASNNVTVYNYNNLGWLTSETYIGKAASYTYDAGGRRASATDRKAQTTTYEYYLNNLLQRVNYADGLAIAFQYDAAGNRISVTQTDPYPDTDRSQAVTTWYNSDLLTKEYTPDPLNRVNNVVREMQPGLKYETRYGYDKMGSITSIIYPGSTQPVEYNRDAFSRVKEIPGFTAPSGADNGIIYSNAGVLKRVDLSNLYSLQITPDELRRPSEISYVKENDESALLKMLYEYKDNEMNIELIQKADRPLDVTRDQTKRYDYDVLDQLTSEGRTGQNITEVRQGVVTPSTFSPGQDLKITYTWMARPTLNKCCVETTLVDSNGFVLYKDRHDPFDYTGPMIWLWDGLISYSRDIMTPAIQPFHGTVDVLVTLVDAAGERQLMQTVGDGVESAGERCYRIAGFEMTTDADDYHKNLLSDDFRDQSRIDLANTDTSLLCGTNFVQIPTQTTTPNILMYYDRERVTSTTNNWMIGRKFEVYVDARDKVYNLKAQFEGKGEVAVYIDGKLKASKEYTTSGTRTYSVDLDVSALSVGYHTIQVNICSTAILASFKNDWIKVYIKNRVEAIGGTLTSADTSVSQLIYTEGTDSAYWDTSCTIKQDGLMKKLRIKCSGYALVGGYLVVKVNGVVKKTEAVPLSRWDIYTDVTVSDIPVGGNLAIEASFHTSPNVNSASSDFVTIQEVDTDRGDGMEVYITSKAVQTRTYTVRSKTLQTERQINGGIIEAIDKEGTVTGEIVAFDENGDGKVCEAYAELILVHNSQSRSIPKLKKYSGLLELAAPSEEQPEPDRDRIFDYDATGNRIRFEENSEEDTYVIDPGNRVKETSDEIFNYDDNGNMIGRTHKVTGETWDYIYDARNCMIEVQKNGSTVARYVYDPEGNRIKAIYPQGDGTNEGIYYHYDYTGMLTENPIVEEPDSGPRRNFIFLNGKIFARVDGQIESGSKYWYMTDHLGSAHGLMDEDGTMVWWADYEAFGKPKGVGGPDSGAVDEVPRFTGKVWDEKIGLYYFNARWYDPKFGRFVSEDPVTIKELIEEQLSSAGQISKNANLYHYCYSNPLNLIDASGEHPKDASSVLLKYRLMKDPYHDTTGKKIAIWGVKFLFSLVCPVFGAVCVIEELVIILDETDYEHIVDYEDRLKFLHEAEDTMKANEKRINEIKAILAGGGLSKEEVDKLTDELTALTIDNERLAKEIEINREYDQKEKEEIESFNGYVVHGEKLFYVDERSSDYQE